MIKKLLRILFTIGGLLLGFFIGKEIITIDVIANMNFIKSGPIGAIILLLTTMFIFGIITFLISPMLINRILKMIEGAERYVQKIPASDVVFATLGAGIGLIGTSLIFANIKINSLLWSVVSIIITIIMAVLGADISRRKKDDILNLFVNAKKSTSNMVKEKKHKNNATPKILDTSVIIDGRILDICQTGFIEGTLIIPQFVLEELRHIADSADDLKRNRGRRGLDILNKIQNELIVPVEISEVDFPDIAEVDSKLLKLGQVLNGKVLTNDYNLNKVAQFQGVAVLNINELANAIKPVVLPGEEMNIQIIKDGKESGQGIAYLDDGTMIVVEGGKRCIGEQVNVVVTSVLQTAAGRMIFARRKDSK